MKAWVEGPRRILEVIFIVSPFLPHTLSLAAFWASEGYQGWLPAHIPVGMLSSSGTFSPSGPTSDACQSPYWLPGEQRGRRSGRGWGTQLQQPRALFPPPGLGLWGRGSPGRKARVATSLRGPRCPLLCSQPSCPQSLSILGLHLVPFLDYGPFAPGVAICLALPASLGQAKDTISHGSCSGWESSSQTHACTPCHAGPCFCLTTVIFAVASSCIFLF